MRERFTRAVTSRIRSAVDKVMGSVKWSEFKKALKSLARNVAQRNASGAISSARRAFSAQSFIDSATVRRRLNAVVNYGMSQIANGNILHPIDSIRRVGRSTASYAIGTTRYQVTAAIKRELVSQARDIARETFSVQVRRSR